MNHQHLKAYKIGGGGNRRIEEHFAKGWVMIKTWDMKSPILAYQLEGEVLQYVRNIWELPQYLSNSEMPQHGATETFSSDEREVFEVMRLIENLMETVSI
jgi:hypothetical protein